MPEIKVEYNWEAVKNEIIANPDFDINEQDSIGTSLLSKAVFYDNIEMMQFLLDRGGDVNIQDTSGTTPLGTALSMGSKEMANLILDHNDVDINLPRSDISITPFEFAIHRDENEIVKRMVLEKNPIIKLSYIRSIISNSNYELLELMLEAKPEFATLKIDDTRTILDTAIYYNNDKIIKLIEQTTDLQKLSADTLELAKSNDWDEVKKIIKKNPLLNFKSQDGEGNNLLVLAAKQKNSELVEYIENAMKEQENRFVKKWSPKKKLSFEGIKHAFASGAKAIVDKIFPSPSKHLRTQQAIQAVREGDLSGLRDLLAKGIDLNKETNNFKSTILMKAISSNRISSYLVRAILKHNPDINAQNIAGNTALIKAAAYGDTTSIKAILAKKPNLEIKNNEGNTALNVATMNGNKKAVELLIKAGANINNQNDLGVTPLMQAMIQNITSVAEVLINNGADINLREKEGLTPLTFAIFRQNEKITKRLLTKNADLGPENGETLLHRAMADGNTNIIKMIKSAIEKNNQVSSTLIQDDISKNSEK